MSRKKFWKLSFYEWSLWSLKIVGDLEKRIEDKKFFARLARRMMLVSAKVMGAKNVKESDFWRLPDDGEEETGKEYTPEEFDAKFEAFLERTKKKKKNG